MSDIKKYQNWTGLEEYTKEIKEWIWKLFRKVHARIGYVEEELAYVRENAKTQVTLNSSTPNYVNTSTAVDETGRIITTSVGVKVATLADASNNGENFKALADARNVYEELTTVEEVIATVISTMAKTIGLNSDFSITWTDESGIEKNTSIVKAIEEILLKSKTS